MFIAMSDVQCRGARGGVKGGSKKTNVVGGTAEGVGGGEVAMENPPDFYRIMSLRLSRALSDIGVNSWMVRRRRRTFLMLEADNTINRKLQGHDVTIFYFGSQSEGTTTPGLNSDIDILFCYNDTNIMSSWSEWEAGRKNMLMVKEETCSPQHYLLQ
ncbi:hypothetical protein MAR_001941, partial [Mya arenaria]